MAKLSKLGAILAAGFAIAACESTGIASGDQSIASESERVVAEYRLGVDDQIRVIVFDEENLSGEFVIDSSGSVSLPLIGEVDALGKTVREFQRSYEMKLRDGYLKDPRINVEVLNFRPYYILGEVTNSGEYPYSNGLTVLNAVATAGGFSYRANKKVIFIKRAGENAEIRYPLTVTTPVQPGDTIRIAERLF